MKIIYYSISFLMSLILVGCASSSGNMQASGECVSQSPNVAYADGLINLATKGASSQSSTYHHQWDATPDLANDGNTDGAYQGHSVSHTNSENKAWWQVDLGHNYDIEKIVIWNRTDHGMGKRLTNFSLIVTDESDKTVFNRTYCRGGKFFSPAMIVDIPKGLNGRYVKVMLNGKNYLQLAEVEVLSENK